MDTQSLSQNYTVILNPDQNISKLEEQLAAEEAELRAKWEREWQEFQVTCISCVTLFRDKQNSEGRT